MTRILSVFVAAVTAMLLALPSAYAETNEYVPLFRSVDNFDIFDTSNAARAAAWQKMEDDGVDTLVLSVALFSPKDFWGNNRPDKTYLSNAQLADVKNVIDTYNFKVKVIGGYGLRPGICDDHPTNMNNLGIAAAEWEYTNVISRLHQTGIDIDIDYFGTDGGFRRLIEHSTKGGSCAIGSDKVAGTPDDHDLTAAQAADAVHAYYKTMRNRIELNQTPDVEITHLFNLVNWKTTNHAAPPFVDANQPSIETLLAEIVSNLNGDTSANPLEIVSVSIDYPYSTIVQTDPNNAKYAGALAGYKHRVGRLYWSGMKQSSRWTNEIRQILTTSYTLAGNGSAGLPEGYGGVLNCVWNTNAAISVNDIPYLPYRNSNNTKLNVADPSCFNNQVAQDATYQSHIELLYDRVATTYRNASVPASVVDHYRWQSWVAYPASSITFMNNITNKLP